MRPLPFPFALNIGTDIVHLPRIARLVNRPGGDYLTRFTRRILSTQEQKDFHARFNLHLPSSTSAPSRPPFPITSDMTRWLAGRFAAKEAARKAAPGGAATIGWKDVVVRVGDSEMGSGRPDIVYLGEDGEGREGRLSISHDGEYVVATVVAAG